MRAQFSLCLGGQVWSRRWYSCALNADKERRWRPHAYCLFFKCELATAEIENIHSYIGCICEFFPDFRHYIRLRIHHMTSLAIELCGQNQRTYIPNYHLVTPSPLWPYLSSKLYRYKYYACVVESCANELLYDDDTTNKLGLLSER